MSPRMSRHHRHWTSHRPLAAAPNLKCRRVPILSFSGLAKGEVTESIYTCRESPYLRRGSGSIASWYLHCATRHGLPEAPEDRRRKGLPTKSVRVVEKDYFSLDSRLTGRVTLPTISVSVYSLGGQTYVGAMP